MPKEYLECTLFDLLVGKLGNLCPAWVTRKNARGTWGEAWSMKSLFLCLFLFLFLFLILFLVPHSAVLLFPSLFPFFSPYSLFPFGFSLFPFPFFSLFSTILR